MNAKSLQVTTPSDATLQVVRDFNAPRRMVWEAMFTPDKMRRWMLPPPGLTLNKLDCVTRVGASLRLTWKNAESDPAMSLLGVFTEVVLHERAIHTETMLLGNGDIIGSLVEKHEFSEKAGVTTMRITQTYESKEARDGAAAGGMDEGMEACYQALEVLLR